MLNTAQEEAAANWTFPSSNISSVEIRAYIIYENNIAEFETAILQEVPRIDPTVASTTPDSVSVVQSSCFFIVVTQLLMLLTTSELLS